VTVNLLGLSWVTYTRKLLGWGGVTGRLIGMGYKVVKLKGLGWLLKNKLFGAE